MTLGILRGVMDGVPEYCRLRDGVRGGARRLTAEVPAKAAAFTLATLRRDVDAPTLVVAPRPEDARRLHEQLLAWCGDDEGLLHFPESEILPFERLDSDVETVHQRLRVLAAVASTVSDIDVQDGEDKDNYPHPFPLRAGSSPPPSRGKTGHALMVVASVGALMQRTLGRDVMAEGSYTLRRGEQVELGEMLDMWRRLGYRFESAVYGPGVVSRRGGIIDIFPVGADLPARIEFWGNEIDSIRLFDPATQRSGDVVDSVQVTPAHEILPAMTPYGELERLAAFVDVGNCTPRVQSRIQQELELLMEGQDVEEQGFYAGFFNSGGLADYFMNGASLGNSASLGDGALRTRGGALLVAYKPDEIADAAWEIQERGHQLRETKEGRGELPRNFPSSHLSWKDVEAQFEGFSQRVDVQVDTPVVSPWEDEDALTVTPSQGERGHSEGVDVALPFLATGNYYGNLERFVEDVWELTEEDRAMVVAVSSHSRRLAEIFGGEGVDVALADGLDDVPAAGSITLMQSAAGGLSDGFSLPVNGRGRSGDREGRLVVFSDVEIFGVAKQRRTRRRSVRAARDAFCRNCRRGTMWCMWSMASAGSRGRCGA